APPTPLLTDPDAYAVYAALIRSSSPVTAAHAKRLVIQETTATYPRCFPSEEALKASPWKEVVEDYKRQNATTLTLTAAFPLDLPYDLAREPDILELFRDRNTDGWKLFYAAHPDSGGYFVMSAVGFDGEKTRALVYFANFCGWLCGQGSYHFLQKVEG